jgi:alkylhydroperoxidase family enzyme
MTLPPRIPPVQEPSAEQAEILAATTLPGGTPLNLFRTLVHHPTLAKRTNVLAGMFLIKGLLPARERELVILRVATRCGCAYEYEQHRRIALGCGLRSDEIDRTAGNEGWPAAEAALLRFADALVDGTVAPDDVWDGVRSNHTDEQLLELTMLVGCYRMLAGVLNSVRVPLDGLSDADDVRRV